MLDDENVLRQRDPDGMLAAALRQYQDVYSLVEVQAPDHDGREIKQLIVVGAGEDLLGARLIKSWLKRDLKIPLETVCSYQLPEYANYHTLVVIVSYSGNDSEAVACYKEARDRFSQVAVLTSGGELQHLAKEGDVTHVLFPPEVHPRMTFLYQLRALTTFLGHFGVTSFGHFDELKKTTDWLKEAVRGWGAASGVDKNHAKQLALLAVGKSPVFNAADLMSPVAYKWKLSWNMNAKNMAFLSELPDFSHGEILGWLSHPIEKPFAVFNIRSGLEYPQVSKQFETSSRLLSGKRPQPYDITLEGETAIAQMLWGCALADFASIYTGILNGVNPFQTTLLEKLAPEVV